MRGACGIGLAWHSCGCLQCSGTYLLACSIYMAVACRCMLHLHACCIYLHLHAASTRCIYMPAASMPVHTHLALQAAEWQMARPKAYIYVIQLHLDMLLDMLHLHMYLCPYMYVMHLGTLLNVGTLSIHQAYTPAIGDAYGGAVHSITITTSRRGQKQRDLVNRAHDRCGVPVVAKV